MRSAARTSSQAIQNSGPMCKRVAAPGIELSLPAISEQDERDIVFGIQNDMVQPASFIQRPSDVEIHRRMRKRRSYESEDRKSRRHVQQLWRDSRGFGRHHGRTRDLGGDQQKMFLSKKYPVSAVFPSASLSLLPQMLESSVTNPRPTHNRGQISGNAIFDGADAMLSVSRRRFHPCQADGVDEHDCPRRAIAEYDSIIRARSDFVKRYRDRCCLTRDRTACLRNQRTAAIRDTTTQSATQHALCQISSSNHRRFSPNPGSRTSHQPARWGVYSIRAANGRTSRT